ncbi:MAG: hypothetical protein HOQ29_09355 [Acidobacteria bacterium]|nr:hypothetical protein [Acidobacteriota bacterium]
MTRHLRSTVLLLEPHPDSAAMFAEVLRWAGFRVETTMSASAGRTVLPRPTPDLVIVGLRSCEGPVSAALSGGHSIPTIAITSDPRDTEQADALGYASVLLRPVDPARLIAEVRRALHSAWHSTPGAA